MISREDELINLAYQHCFVYGIWDNAFLYNYYNLSNYCLELFAHDLLLHNKQKQIYDGMWDTAPLNYFALNWFHCIQTKTMHLPPHNFLLLVGEKEGGKQSLRNNYCSPYILMILKVFRISILYILRIWGFITVLTFI